MKEDIPNSQRMLDSNLIVNINGSHYAHSGKNTKKRPVTGRPDKRPKPKNKSEVDLNLAVNPIGVTTRGQ